MKLTERKILEHLREGYAHSLSDAAAVEFATTRLAKLRGCSRKPELVAEIKITVDRIHEKHFCIAGSN